MKRKNFSLGAKIAILVISIYALFAAIAVVISYSVYVKDMDDHYKSLARNIARTAASQMDGDKLPDYAVTGIMDDEYNRMLNILFDIKESNDIAFLYIQVIQGDNAMYIMDADRTETACPLGQVDPLAEAVYPYLEHLEDGIPPFITHSDYGWLSSACAPIFDSSGKVSSIVGVDISMGEIMARRANYLGRFLLLMSVAMALTISVFLRLSKRFIVSPVNLLAEAATSFVSTGHQQDSAVLATSAISELDIHSGDEIERLCAAMKTMASDIVDYIRNITSITAEKERISAELDVASLIQSSMLPCVFPPFPDRKDFDLFAMMIPAKEVGGDFYDFFMIGADHLAMIIADVSGKGVPAALFMVISKTLLKEQIMMNDRLDEAIAEVNRQLCESNGENMFVTVWAGVLEISSGRLIFVNGGHNPPLVRKKSGFEFLENVPSLALAIMPEIEYTQREIILDGGDVLFLYTDGVTEAMDGSLGLYGNDMMRNILNSAGDVYPDELLQLVLGDILGFVKDIPQSDDITMLALRLHDKN